MITDCQLVAIGKFGQPHGIKGELNAYLEVDVDVEALRCIVCNIDGINVPFFVSAVRQRSATSLLLTIDGIANEKEATLLQNKPIFALKEEVDIAEDELDDEEGFYAEDLIGYTIADSESDFTGVVEGIDDSTENVLFIVKADSDGATVLIPVADELITELNPESRHIEVALPEGLLTL